MTSSDADMDDLEERVRLLERTAAENAYLAGEVAALRSKTHDLANQLQPLLTLSQHLAALTLSFGAMREEFSAFKGKVLGAASALVFLVPLLTAAAVKLVR